MLLEVVPKILFLCTTFYLSDLFSDGILIEQFEELSSLLCIIS